MNATKVVKCNDSRPCGGRDPKRGICRCLDSNYPDGKCPFCKPDFAVTKGKTYYYTKNN